jgi:beta-glucosidase
MQNAISGNVFSAEVEQAVVTLLEKMTLAEKIGQMTQVEKNSITPTEVTEYFIGSVLSGGGGNPEPNRVQTWTEMVHGFQDAALQTRLQIPIIYGVDAVHGHNNVRGAVIFPHNIGLGASRDADLVEKIGRITATEILATGVTWTFAPALSVPQDIRWGRTYEGFSDNPEIVARLGQAYVRGVQELRANQPQAIGCAKHFVADGGTKWNSTQYYPWLSAVNWQAATPNFKIDQGDAQLDEASLRRIHLAPYFDVIQEGVLTVMVSFSSWNGHKLHAHKYLVTDVLKGEMNFPGFVVSDWGAVDQLDSDYYDCVVQTINAGLDMVMTPFDYKRFIMTLTEAVDKGAVSLQRIDDAVTRILRVKYATGLFEYPYGNPELISVFGSAEHRAVAREAVSKSLVLLKNENAILPLAKDLPELVVVGSAADDIGIQCGGWTIEWQGQPGEITEGTTLLKGIQSIVSEQTRVIFRKDGQFSADEQFRTGIVVLGETPYAEGAGDKADLLLSAEDIALIEQTAKHCQRVICILLSGRPLIINDQLGQMDAFVAAWLPGTEGQGVADVLFGDKPFTGKLSFNWPRTPEQIPLTALENSQEPPQWKLGDGLTT